MTDRKFFKGLIITMMLAIACLLVGCDGGLSSTRGDFDSKVMGDDGKPINTFTTTESGQPKGTMHLSGDTIAASYPGQSPTGVYLSADVMYKSTPAITTTFHLLGLGSVDSVGDTVAKGITVSVLGPDGKIVKTISIDEISSNKSAPAAVYASMLQSTMNAVQGMNQQDALRRIEEMKVLGQITADVADMASSIILKMVAPIP